MPEPKLIHCMLRVLSEDRSVEFYRKALGMEVVRRHDFPGFVLLYLRNAESSFELELTVNKDREKPYTLGDAYGHIAVAVTNIFAERARMQEQGLDVSEVKDLSDADKCIARFFFAADPDGYKIEFIEANAAYR